MANTATTMRKMAPTRSTQGARLNNTHQITIASKPTIPAINP